VIAGADVVRAVAAGRAGRGAWRATARAAGAAGAVLRARGAVSWIVTCGSGCAPGAPAAGSDDAGDAGGVASGAGGASGCAWAWGVAGAGAGAGGIVVDGGLSAGAEVSLDCARAPTPPTIKTPPAATHASNAVRSRRSSP